jgi:hypothetical protein
MRGGPVPTVEVVTSWLEVACVLLLVAAAAVWAWSVCPAAGLAAGGVAAGVASVVLSVLSGARGRK